MVQLVAYFDESGTHAQQSQVVCVCGLIGTAIEWSRMELPWLRRLHVIGISEFHASKCAGEVGRDEFHTLTADLSQQLANRKLDIVSAAILREDWDQYATAETKRRFTTPYHFCFELAMQKVASWSRSNANGDIVALYFANHQQYQKRATRIHKYYYHSKAYPSLGTLSFGTPRFVVPLQAADMLAYETYQYVLSRATEKASDEALLTKRPVLKKLLELLSDPKNGSFYDRDNLPQLRPNGVLK